MVLCAHGGSDLWFEIFVKRYVGFTAQDQIFAFREEAGTARGGRPGRDTPGRKQAPHADGLTLQGRFQEGF